MSDTLKQLTHDQIHPSDNNLRLTFDDLDELEDSIVGVGLQQALLVRKNADGFELIAGERRWRAIGRAIEKGRLPADYTISSIVRTGVDDAIQTAAMIVENLHRAGLAPTEEYAGIMRLANEHGWDAKEISRQTGIPLSTVKARMSWAKLPGDRLVELVAVGGVTQVTELASLDADTVTKVLKAKSDKLGTEMRLAVERKQREERAKKLTAHLRRQGHLVIRSMDDLLDKRNADEKALFDKLAKQAKKDGGEVQDRYVFGTIPEDFPADKFTAPTLFIITVDQWNVNVKLFKVHVAPGHGVSSPAAGVTGPRAQSQFEIDREAATEAFEQAKAEHREQLEAAKRELIRNGKPSDLIPMIIHWVIEEIDDEAAHEFELCDAPEDPDDAGISVREFADKNASNLARAAAAYILFWQHGTPPGFPETPRYVGPVRAHYDADGNKLTAEQIAEAEAAAAQAQAEREAEIERDERINDLDQPLQRDDFESDEEFEAAQSIRAEAEAFRAAQDAEAEAVD